MELSALSSAGILAKFQATPRVFCRELVFTIAMGIKKKKLLQALGRFGAEKVFCVAQRGPGASCGQGSTATLLLALLAEISLARCKSPHFAQKRG